MTKYLLTILLLFPLLAEADQLRDYVNTWHYWIGVYDEDYPNEGDYERKTDSMVGHYDLLVVGDDFNPDLLPMLRDSSDAQGLDLTMIMYTDHMGFGSTSGSRSYDFAINTLGYRPDQFEDLLLHFTANDSQQIGVGRAYVSQYTHHRRFGYKSNYGSWGQGIFSFDSSTTTYTDLTTDAYNDSTGSSNILQEISDVLYIGHYGMFDTLRFDLSSFAGGAFAVQWQYPDSVTGWTNLSVTDGTNGFTQDGVISFTAPGLLKWKDTLIDDETAVCYWVRGVVTNVGSSQPSVYQIVGADYITENATYIDLWDVPGWDDANDTDNDGVWDTNNNPNATAMFYWQARCKHPWGWRETNNLFNPNDSALCEIRSDFAYWVVNNSSYVDTDILNGYYGDDFAYDGLPQLHASPNWFNIEEYEDYADEAEADSAYQEHFVNPHLWIVKDSLISRDGDDTTTVVNISLTDVIPRYAPDRFGDTSRIDYLVIEVTEFVYGPLSIGSALSKMAKRVAGANQGQKMCQEWYYGTTYWQTNKARWDNFTLAHYYMTHSEFTYFGIVGNNSGLQHHLGIITAVNCDIGQPVKPATDSLDYPWDTLTVSPNILLSREFENGIVVVTFGANPGVSDSATLETYDLGAPYRRVMSTGETLSVSSSIDLLDMDGAILLSAANVTTTITDVTSNSLNLIYTVSGYVETPVDSIVVYGDDTDASTRIEVLTQVPSDTTVRSGLTPGSDYYGKHAVWWTVDTEEFADTSTVVHVVLSIEEGVPVPIRYKGGKYLGGKYK